MTHRQHHETAWAQVSQAMGRRAFLQGGGMALGATALQLLLAGESPGAEKAQASAAPSPTSLRTTTGLPGLPHFAARAKRVIYLFQSGAPSQLDLFDPKPKLEKLRGEELPDSVRRGQRLTGMTSSQESFPIAPSRYRFERHGESGAWVSELLPHTASVADDLCFIKTLHTEAINHDPAVTFFQTGAQLAGRPSMGAWVSYGLGSGNADLPSFVAMVSQGSGNPNDQPLYDRLWGSGFLPTRFQGVKFRSVGDPVLHLSNPAGVDATTRRRMLDDLALLNRFQADEDGDPEIATRIAQYEMAYRMQTSVPELTDTSNEPAHVFERYGPESKVPGTYAANCLLARRLGRAWREIRAVVPSRLGSAHEFAEADRRAVSRHRPTVRGVGRRLERAWTLGRYPGGLGRRIWTHGLLPGSVNGRQLWTRSSSALLHGLAGGRRRKAWFVLRRDG
jgi:hypothetical protein